MTDGNRCKVAGQICPPKDSKGSKSAVQPNPSRGRRRCRRACAGRCVRRPCVVRSHRPRRTIPHRQSAGRGPVALERGAFIGVKDLDRNEICCADPTRQTRPATAQPAPAQDPLPVWPTAGRRSRIRTCGNCAPGATHRRNRGPCRTHRPLAGPRRGLRA